jgi:transposase
MDKKWLEEQHNKGLSQREIAALANVSTPTIRTWFKKYNIKPRSISEALKLNPVKSKWTEERRSEFSTKMALVQKSRKAELSESAINNWNKNRKALEKGIKKSARSRKIDIDGELLLSLVLTNSIKQVSLILGYSKSTIRRLIREKFGINDLQHFKSFKIDIDALVNYYQDNTQAECGEHFGTSTTTIGRILLSYGIDTSIHFGPSFSEKISEIVKRRWLDESYRHKMAIARSSTNRISGIQKKLYSILEEMGVSYDIEFVVGPYTFDCKVGDILIECNGEYWHSIDKVISNDHNKSLYINNYHPQYKLRVLWEHEFNNANRVKHLIKYWLGNEQDIVKYDFKEISISLIESGATKKFFGAYHYLSHCPRGGTAIVGSIKDELIIASLFSPIVRQNLPYDKDSTNELSRFCIHPNYQKRNLGSWFLSKAFKLLPNNIRTIISYSDLTHNHEGSLYKASNFVVDHIVKPDYWYVKEDGWVLHKKTVYNKAKARGMKESEYANQENLQRIKGKEKICYRYDLK